MSALLDPATLARLRPVGLRAQRIAEGLWSGLHPSRLKGASLEFSEHKQYSPGDELRHLDWKVYGKTDRLFIKQFEDETNIQAISVVDTSGSMGYCSAEMAPGVDTADTSLGGGVPVVPGPVSKLVYAAMLAAGLSYLLQGQQDAVGLARGAARLDLFMPPRRGPRNLAALLSELESLVPKGEARLGALCRPILETQRRKTLVLLFTDAFDLSEDDWAVFRQLRARGNELVLFHVLDPFELAFPFQSWSDFQGLEGEVPIQVDPLAQRESYLKRLEQFLSTIRENCIRSGISYFRALTSEPPQQPLLSFLLSRQGTRR